jgi:hypothetical protein
MYFSISFLAVIYSTELELDKATGY